MSYFDDPEERSAGAFSPLMQALAQYQPQEPADGDMRSDAAQIVALLRGTRPGSWFQGDDPRGGYVGRDQYQHGYTSAKPGWHDWETGDNLLCTAAEGCTPEMVGEQSRRFGVPGWDPTSPIVSGQVYPAYDVAWTGLQGGPVRTEVSPDGLTITNTTLPSHLFHDGQIHRRIYQDQNGDWRAKTRGWGNNEGWVSDRIDGNLLAALNTMMGPRIFNKVDDDLRRGLQELLKTRR